MVGFAPGGGLRLPDCGHDRLHFAGITRNSAVVCRIGSAGGGQSVGGKVA